VAQGVCSQDAVLALSLPEKGMEMSHGSRLISVLALAALAAGCGSAPVPVAQPVAAVPEVKITVVAPKERPAKRRKKVARRVTAAPVVVHQYAPPVGNVCAAGVAVGPETSCPFALNVRDAYYRHGPGTVVAYSPVTRLTYAMSCTPTPVVCTGGNHATVYLS
jgi:hypothetical protein